MHSPAVKSLSGVAPTFSGVGEGTVGCAVSTEGTRNSVGAEM